MNMRSEIISKSYLLLMVLLEREVILKRNIRLISRAVFKLGLVLSGKGSAGPLRSH